MKRLNPYEDYRDSKKYEDEEEEEDESESEDQGYDEDEYKYLYNFLTRICKERQLGLIDRTMNEDYYKDLRKEKSDLDVLKIIRDNMFLEIANMFENGDDLNVIDDFINHDTDINIIFDENTCPFSTDLVKYAFEQGADPLKALNKLGEYIKNIENERSFKKQYLLYIEKYGLTVPTIDEFEKNPKFEKYIDELGDIENAYDYFQQEYLDIIYKKLYWCWQEKKL